MASADAAQSVEPPLSFSQVQKLVEAVSPAIRLEFDDGMRDRDEGSHAVSPKGRFLVARRAIAAGEIFLSEHPLFCGSTDGAQSRKAYNEDFAALLDADVSDDEFDEDLDDCVHPASPLIDCLAGIILAKQRAVRSDSHAERTRAKLRLRQLSSLCRVDATDAAPEAFARELMCALRPELRELTSEEEVHGLVLALCSNRFGGADSRLDLMFAGSMFEHSCMPNCFAGTWQGAGPAQARAYRALRDVAEGEALSIDYLLLPDGYLPASGRAELLGRWGFACSCARCTTLPELTRCFVCQCCGASELCPRHPGAGAGWACVACSAEPTAVHLEACLAQEAEALRASHGGAAAVAEAGEAGEARGEAAGDGAPPPPGPLLGRWHHAAFAPAWARVAAPGTSGASGRGEGGGVGALAAYRADVELLVEAIRRLYCNPQHPHLLDLFHVLATLEQGDISAQLHFLELERTVLRRYYPEEAARQDDEIMRLVQGRGPFTAPDASAHAGAWGFDLLGSPGMELGAMD